MRLLIIGMETHLQTREEELEKTVNVAKEKEKQLVALKKAELASWTAWMETLLVL